jgi:serine/threonine-protein kinase
VSRSTRQPLRTKLLDFGIAKRLDDEAPQRTSGGQILGTPAYMSPEQCEARPVTPAADIYSLGVMAFELLTGKRPLNASSATALRAAHVRSEPALASEVSRALPRGVDLPLRAMLAKDPEERPRSASEPIAEVRAAIDRAQRSGSRRRIAAAIGIAAVVVAGLLMARSRHAAVVATGSAEPGRATEAVPSPSVREVQPMAASSVVVRVIGAPPGAVLLDQCGAQHDVGEPLRLQRGSSPVTLTLSAPLHRPKQLALVPDRDQEIDGTLPPAPSSRAATPARKKRSAELEY